MAKTKSRESNAARAAGNATGPAEVPAARRLTYKEKQELAALPARIEELEADIAHRHQSMAAPEFYKRPGDEIAAETTTLRELETELANAYERWEELEERAG